MDMDVIIYGSNQKGHRGRDLDLVLRIETTWEKELKKTLNSSGKPLPDIDQGWGAVALSLDQIPPQIAPLLQKLTAFSQQNRMPIDIVINPSKIPLSPGSPDGLQNTLAYDPKKDKWIFAEKPLPTAAFQNLPDKTTPEQLNARLWQITRARRREALLNRSRDKLEKLVDRLVPPKR
jgi:hypothetical protein